MAELDEHDGAEPATSGTRRRVQGKPGGGVGLGKNQRVVIGAAAVVLVAVVVVAVLSVVSGGEEPAARPTGPESLVGKPAESGSSPTSYSSSPSSDAYKGIASRRADAAPLTEGELFPSTARTLTVTDAKSKLRLVGERLDSDCARAVWGAAVGEKLRRGGCTQAARSMYADTRRGYALSVTIFNLASAADADRVVDALGQGRGGGFVRPLTVEPDGVTVSPTPGPTATPRFALENFGQGFSAARGLAMGHYTVIAWAQRLDGEGDGADGALLALLIEGGKAPAVLDRAVAVA